LEQQQKQLYDETYERSQQPTGDNSKATDAKSQGEQTTPTQMLVAQTPEQAKQKNAPPLPDDLATIRGKLSERAKAEFDAMRESAKTDEQFREKLGKGDPVRRFEADAAKKENVAKVAAERKANLEAVEQLLSESKFYDRLDVQTAILEGKDTKLRELISVEIARQEAETRFPTQDGYKTYDGVKALEEVPGYTSVEEWKAANPDLAYRAPGYVEHDGKVYSPITDIDLMTVKLSDEGEPAQIVHLEQIKSGERDKGSAARKQLAKSADVFYQIEQGNLVQLHHEKQDITSEFDAKSVEGAEQITRGPEGKAGFDKSLGLSAAELDRFAKRVIEDARNQEGGEP
jgi:hypothetical protein